MNLKLYKISSIILSFSFCLTFSVSFANENDVADKYIEKANKLELYKNREWLALLHYNRNAFGIFKSIIDSKNFFFDKKGYKNPKNELNETIKAFFNKDITETETKQHAICAFPARFEFLNKYLDFSKSELPKPKCDRFKQFFTDIDPNSLAIIFPTTYINNPASMFGHTLIRIDKKGNYEKNSHLNSIIINYGADTKGEISGIIYAFRGVFGLYSGFFSASQYYKITNNYGNLENRDIWEYKLNYTKEEAEFYTKHIWELIFANSNYYFFKRNCSYMILESLNPLRPELRLTKNFLFSTSPIDTIRLLKQKNIITENNYRMSLEKQIKYTNLTKKERKNVKKMVIDADFLDKYEKENSENKENNKQVYETAYKLLQYKKAKNEIDLKFYRKQSIKILKNINKTGSIDEKNISEYKAISPDNGHYLKRLKLNFGYFKDKKNFIELTYKPVYHDLTDDGRGFEFGSTISFFDMSFRYYIENKDFELEKFNFIDIKSLAPQNTFFKPTSFSVLFGVNNLYDDYKVLMLDTNGGFTFGNENLAFFILAGIKINENRYFKNDFAFGVNGTTGILLNIQEEIKLLLNYKINKLIESSLNYNQFLADFNIIMNKNFNINLGYSNFNYNNFDNKEELLIGFRYFF